MKSDDLVFDMEDIQPLPYQSYHMITNTIAIGDYTSPYEPFDIIFNFNYPQNGATLGKIHTTIDHTHPEKIIYLIGLLDTTIYTIQLLYIFMELGPYLAKSKGKRILFHCYAGISRSSTAAIMYFMMTTYLPLEAIFRLLLSKRPFIDPNPVFRHILQICNHKREIMNT
jgi:protein-tyrosine phosphatase